MNPTTGHTDSASQEFPPHPARWARLLMSLVAMIGIALIASPLGALAQTGGTAVSISNFAFHPASISVPAGSTVTWTNGDPTAHTVTADNASFDSGDLAQGKTFSFTFKTPGTFSYHCDIHPFMKGTINVTAAAAAPAAPASVSVPPAASPAASPAPRASAAAPTASSAGAPVQTPSGMPKTGAGGGAAQAPILLLGIPVLVAVALFGRRLISKH